MVEGRSKGWKKGEKQGVEVGKVRVEKKGKG